MIKHTSPEDSSSDLFSIHETMQALHAFVQNYNTFQREESVSVGSENLISDVMKSVVELPMATPLTLMVSVLNAYLKGFVAGLLFEKLYAVDLSFQELARLKVLYQCVDEFISILVREKLLPASEKSCEE